MQTLTTAIPGVLIFEPKVFGDARGFFMETWNHARYSEAGLDAMFKQDNMSRSQKGVLRGLHFQWPNPQGKLVSVIEGEVFDVAVDIRLGSPTFGKHVAVRLSAENRRQFYIPEGFAHGFVVLSEAATFTYKCTDLYRPENEHALLWNDPELGIEWPMTEPPSLSAKDAKGLLLRNLPRENLPAYNPGARR
jgi:dTDP-4-dehydrorhamnose 3,5-epimerase